ncbi:MAG TPA: HAMP domain-containing sensor histidine kinase [Gemmatimonadaceae bacterium]|nr:HAMP domain-containing sensor histidine kinase [Gemmatimonadaceae bacterium]
MSARFPFILVVVSLVAIAILPLPVQRRIKRLNAEITTVAEPGRHAVTEIQSALALEAAAERGFLLTGNERYAILSRKARAQRQLAQSRLEPLAQRIDGDVQAGTTRLATDVRPGDAMLDSLFAGALSRRTYLRRLDMQQLRLESIVHLAMLVDNALWQAELIRQEQIDNTLLVSVFMATLFVLLAMIAAILVRELGVEAERRRVDLERVTESRTRLVRGFTHDVKNPLGAADGFLALLEDGAYGELTPEQKTSLGKSRQSIHAALDLTRQLVELAQAEAGRLNIQPVVMDPREAAREVAEAFRPLALASGLTIEFELVGDVPFVESDPARVRQVLANLVSNAIKYTPAGGHVTIRVAMRRAPKGEARGQWVVTEVHDTGPGIPSEKQRLLFLEFTRLDPEAAHGAGLGLAISQRIASALGGSIQVESAAGTGSTFSLWLPVSSSVHNAQS